MEDLTGGSGKQSAYICGPWDASDEHPEGACIYVKTPDGHEVATVYTLRGESQAQRLINARAVADLIAASPALRDALLPIAAAYPDDPGTSDLDDEQPVRITLGDVRRVWKALAKARTFTATK